MIYLLHVVVQLRHVMSVKMIKFARSSSVTYQSINYTWTLPPVPFFASAFMNYSRLLSPTGLFWFINEYARCAFFVFVGAINQSSHSDPSPRTAHKRFTAPGSSPVRWAVQLRPLTTINSHWAAELRPWSPIKRLLSGSSCYELGDKRCARDVQEMGLRAEDEEFTVVSKSYF